MVTMDTLEVLKAMAIDPKRRLALAKDATCIGGLVIVLSNANYCVVKDALQILSSLSECHEAKPILRNHVGMLDQLEKLVTRGEKDAEVRHAAKQLLFKLYDDPEPIQVPLKDSSISRYSKNNSNHSSTTGKSIVLQLRGFQDKSDRDLCARLLLKTKGVVSITFDMCKKRCILRTKMEVKPEVLAASIAKSMTMTAQQVVKNENGEEVPGLPLGRLEVGEKGNWPPYLTMLQSKEYEVLALNTPMSLISFNSSGHSIGCDREQETLPEYLSDDSEMIVEDKAVKKPTEEDRKKSATWFSAAANFLTNSFYW